MPRPPTQTPHNNFKTHHLGKRTEITHFRFQIIETQEEAKSALDKNRSGKHEYPIEVITELNRQLSLHSNRSAAYEKRALGGENIHVTRQL